MSRTRDPLDRMLCTRGKHKLIVAYGDHRNLMCGRFGCLHIEDNPDHPCLFHMSEIYCKKNDYLCVKNVLYKVCGHDCQCDDKAKCCYCTLGFSTCYARAFLHKNLEWKS